MPVTHSPFFKRAHFFWASSLLLPRVHVCFSLQLCARVSKRKQTADCCLKTNLKKIMRATADAWMISSLKNIKKYLGVWQKVGDQKQKLQMLPWSMLLDKQVPLPKQAAAHWWLLFLPMHHQQHHLHQWSQWRSNETREPPSPETEKRNSTTKKTRQIAIAKKKSVFYVWDDFESGAWHDMKIILSTI